MDKLTDYFNRIYVVNLPERKDRLQDTKVVLSRINLSLDSQDFEVFPAIKPQDSAGFPSVGVRGCFLSHLTILKKALEEGLPNLLILEDDIEFAYSFPKLWPSIAAQFRSQPWDLAYLGYYSSVQKSIYTSWNTKTVEMRDFSGPVGLTHAYAVNASILPLLVRHLERLQHGTPGDRKNGPMNYDGAINILRQQNPAIKTLIAMPQVAWQRSSTSDITSNQWQTLPAMEAVLKPVREVKNYLRRRGI
jgi:GR25 family glycosyltransferase involved in LPS biosynthesis